MVAFWVTALTAICCVPWWSSNNHSRLWFCAVRLATVRPPNP
jgi:hypothetical protein